jgi:glycosyltransferase involved in cell wall biosynthesis
LFGKPVIGANIGGIPELVINGKTGFLFEPGNVDELKEKLLLLWCNPKLVYELGLEAKKHVTGIVNFDDHSSKILSIINGIKK